MPNTPPPPHKLIFSGGDGILSTNTLARVSSIVVLSKVDEGSEGKGPNNVYAIFQEIILRFFLYCTACFFTVGPYFKPIIQL